MSRKIIDLTGKKFGKLTVVERAEDHLTPKGKRQLKWLCQCECGKQVAVVGSSLRSGATTSCGCNRGRKAQGSKAKIWHMNTRNRWAVYVRVGEFKTFEEATAARDKANEMFGKGE